MTYTVQRRVNDNNGRVEWWVIDAQWGETVEVWPTRKQAKAHADSLNKA